MYFDIAKRIIDITVAVVIGVVFAPIWLIIPLLIKLDSPGPIFADIPKRVGKNSRLFFLYKFRSMISNAHDLLHHDPKFRRLLEKYKKNSYKLCREEDPRVTGVGKFLRRFSLDELPQILNVFKGEMSIVGPRAYFPDELATQQEVYPSSRKYVKEISKVKPGITGYWQVTGRSEINFDKRVKMDAEYVKRRAITEDILIILKTPWAMFSGKGAQ